MLQTGCRVSEGFFEVYFGFSQENYRAGNLSKSVNAVGDERRPERCLDPTVFLKPLTELAETNQLSFLIVASMTSCYARISRNACTSVFAQLIWERVGWKELKIGR